MTTLNAVAPVHLEELRRILPPAAFRADHAPYLVEMRGLWQGRAGAVLAPANTDEVAAILMLANRDRIPVIPYSGGTGLVGGQVAPDLAAPIILSTERMTAIRMPPVTENTIQAGAGAILQDIRDTADKAGRYFPLMLASQGSARLGGLLGTNAGGMNVLRYGNARELCLGIEAVLADGTVLSGLKRLRKDNTGYDLRNLLIGSEGTLGIITAATMRLYPKPAHHVTGYLVVPDPSAALDLLAMLGDQVGEAVSVFELISGTGFDFINEKLPDHRLPLDPVPEWCVLVDIGLPAGQDADGLAESLLIRAMGEGLVSDGVIAQNDGQRDAFLNTRETIPEGNRRVGAVASHDISLPLSAIPEFITRAGQSIAGLGPLRINCFGHLGDGNLHYNIFPPQGEDRADWLHLRSDVTRLVHDLTAEYDGSFSAEHGVGRAKTGDLIRYGDPGRIAAMRAIKDALDPNGILNPGAVLART